jgi:DNA repair protein RadC
MAEDTNDNGPTSEGGETDSELFSIRTRADGLETDTPTDLSPSAREGGITIAVPAANAASTPDRQMTSAVEKAGGDGFALADRLAEPEGKLLRAVFSHAPFVSRLARVPGGWRTLSVYELERLGLSADERKAVVSLQELVQRGYPELPTMKLIDPRAVGQVYGQRLGGLMHEVMLAVALDGRSQFLAEIEIARGGTHSLAVNPRDVLRPILRCGASAFVLLHNHPGGDPTPSQRDIEFTHRIAPCADAIDLPLVDHVVIGGRGGGYVSLLALGVLQPVA